jgi:hypothetical protein
VRTGTSQSSSTGSPLKCGDLGLHCLGWVQALRQAQGHLAVYTLIAMKSIEPLSSRFSCAVNAGSM